MIIKLNKKNFESTLNTHRGLIMIEIGAEWCGSCVIMEPIINKVSSDYEGRILIGTVDAAADETIALKYYSGRLPVYLFFTNGHIVDRVSGMISHKKLSSKIDELLNQTGNQS